MTKRLVAAAVLAAFAAVPAHAATCTPVMCVPGTGQPSGPGECPAGSEWGYYHYNGLIWQGCKPALG